MVYQKVHFLKIRDRSQSKSEGRKTGAAALARNCGAIGMILFTRDKKKTYTNNSHQGLVHAHPGTDGLQGTWTGAQLQINKSFHF